MNKTLVIMFVKEPKLGFVKTRLANKSGDEFALELYKNFVKDLIITLQSSKYDFKLCACPSLDLVNETFGNFGNFLQKNGDLGTKMKNAFSEQFNNGYKKIVLLGSDTPHIPQRFFDEAFLKLHDNDIVLGPSKDGGYYLIAFNKQTFYEKVFENIEWSSELVLEQSLQRLNAKRVHLLQELNDIDILSDLKEFYIEQKDGNFKNSSTLLFLKEDKKWRNLT